MPRERIRARLTAERLSCLARNGQPGSPRGWPRGVESPGEESRSDGVAAQPIEAQPVFGQIKPRRGQVLACAEQHPREKTSRTSIAKNKGSQSSGVEKESVAQKRGATHFDRNAAQRLPWL